MDLMQYVTNQTQPMLQCLSESLRIRSVLGPAAENAPFGTEVKRCLDHILCKASELGFETVNLDNHIGWCEYGEGEEMIVVLGHMDVVPEGDGWSFDPYGGEIRDGNILGRGALDDKGPTIAALYALAALRDSGLPLKRRVRVIFGCNEETGSRDVKYYVENGGEIPVMGFTPDASYPVINGEKGLVDVKYSKTYNQTGDLRLVRLQGGTAGNVVPAVAEAEFSCSPALAQQFAATTGDKVSFIPTESGLLVRAEGVNAHGSTPWLGENAVGRLLLALDKLPLTGELKDAVHFLAEELGVEWDGASVGIALEDAVSGKLTLNLGIISGDENALSVVLNYRYPVSLHYEDCGPIINACFQKNGFAIDREGHTNSLYMPEDSELVQTLLHIYREKTGRDEKPLSIGGGTYAKSLPNILAFGPAFPEDEDRAHQADEFAEVEKLVKTMEMIAEAMYALAK